MNQTIYDNKNRVIGYIRENCNTVDAFNANNQKIGYYSKSADITYKNGSFFGRGDQTIRLIHG